MGARLVVEASCPKCAAETRRDRLVAFTEYLRPRRVACWRCGWDFPESVDVDPVVVERADVGPRAALFELQPRRPAVPAYLEGWGLGAEAQPAAA